MESTQIGTLFVVATPIGNYRDMSVRGIDVLRSVDIIASEDTRRTMILLNKLEIHNNLVSNHSYNERSRIRYFIEQIKSGKDIAIVSDAGTPCISDPGNALIKAAISENIKVIGIPGCCAAINALIVSGFDLSSFMFCGFFPRENGDKAKIIKQMRKSSQNRTFVFYESPKRIMTTINYLIENSVSCSICLSNDMTKQHEIIFRGTPQEVKMQLLAKVNYEKGEYVIVMELNKDYLITENEHIFSPEALIVDKIIMHNCSMREAIKMILDDETNTYSKNELYSASIKLKNLLSPTS